MQWPFSFIESIRVINNGNYYYIIGERGRIIGRRPVRNYATHRWWTMIKSICLFLQNTLIDPLRYPKLSFSRLVDFLLPTSSLGQVLMYLEVVLLFPLKFLLQFIFRITLRFFSLVKILCLLLELVLYSEW